MSKIIVLGAGMVGKAMAVDLSGAHDVTAADIDEQALGALRDSHGIETVALDVTDPNRLVRALAGFDLVLGAVPGFLGFKTLTAAIEAGKNIVDISFCPENPLDLDPLAKKRGVSVMVDMGVAPGMDRLLLGHHDASMKVESFRCLVGGLPKKKSSPWNYTAPFSPLDVIEEYVRPAEYVENGKRVTRPALTDPELVDFDRVETLEAFNTAGLRTLLVTMPHIPNMREKTLRYPGHIGLIQALKDSGFFAKEEIAIGDARVSPLEFTAGILTEAWAAAPDEDEFTIMRVTVEGEEAGRKKTYVYDLYDEYDRETGTSSMARTTGYTATAAAQLLLNGLFKEKGVFPPELVGRHPRCFDPMLAYQAERGVVYRKSAS
jgi:saccharopine dehydrogenase-like NADP-dependent oxidoreductase